MTNHALNGAQVILDCLKREGVDTIFGYPGGSAIPLFDALLDSNIKMVLSRHEQGATHMADGYARATGKVGVVLVTSGPGATNTFTGIYTALMDSSPIVVLAAQTTTPNLGKDAFQECDTSGMTFAAVKHSFLVKNPNDLPRIVKEAFHIARSGRPGPVLIDLPKDVTAGNCTASFSDEIDLPGYKIPTYADPSAVEKAAALLKKSTKPLLLVGHGAIISNASRQVKELADVVTKGYADSDTKGKIDNATSSVYMFDKEYNYVDVLDYALHIYYNLKTPEAEEIYLNLEKALEEAKVYQICCLNRKIVATDGEAVYTKWPATDRYSLGISLYSCLNLRWLYYNSVYKASAFDKVTGWSKFIDMNLQELDPNVNPANDSNITPFWMAD